MFPTKAATLPWSEEELAEMITHVPPEARPADDERVANQKNYKKNLGSPTLKPPINAMKPQDVRIEVQLTKKKLRVLRR